MPAPHTYNLFVLSFRKNILLTQNHTWFLLIYPWEAKGRSRNEGSEERGTRNASGNAQGPGGPHRERDTGGETLPARAPYTKHIFK